MEYSYKRLGLAIKLNKPTGGVEKPFSTTSTTNTTTTTTASAVGSFPATTTLTSPAAPLAPGEARIVRDADGNITNIIYGATGEARLDQLEEASAAPQHGQGDEHTTDVVKALMERAGRGVKVQRTQSEREREWIERLVARYGDDYAAMCRDRKLNPYQQSEGDIRKRVGKWRQIGRAHV